jgi:hypothetical protein
MTKEQLQDHKDWLVQTWGEQADSFPGEFHEWLQNRINDKIEEGDTEDLILDVEVFKLEIMTLSPKVKKMAFNENDPNFISTIAVKHNLSSTGIHRLSTTDSRQTLAFVEASIAAKRKEGVDIKLFVSKSTGPVFAAYTNDNLDAFGFCKVLHNGVPKLQTFGQKNVRLF